MGEYADVYAGWKADPEGFWMRAAAADRLDRGADPGARRQPRADLRLVSGRGLQRLLERGRPSRRGRARRAGGDHPRLGDDRLGRVAHLRRAARPGGAAGGRAGGARRGKGDRVVVYMPMVPEALVAMLACARLGAIHSVVFGGFAAPELAVRIDDARPKAMIAASCGIEPGRVVAYKPLVDAAIEMAAHKPEFVRGAAARSRARPSSGRATSSGTRRRRAWRRRPACRSAGWTRSTSSTPRARPGQPKGVVRADRRLPGGARLDACRTSTASRPGDVFWSASDVGWVVGHSYICYGPLIAGATTIVFEGKPVGTPDAGAFWRVIADHRVKSFFTAPTAFRAIKREDPEGRLIGDYDISLAGVPVPGRRAGRSRHGRLGAAAPGGAGDRPLVADRDRLGDRREPGGDRAPAGQAGLADAADAGLRRADPVGDGHAAAGGRARRGGDQAAAAAGRRCRRSGTPRSGS